MAIATDTSLGTVLLAGDIAGGNNANMPQLTPTGVVPGEYKVPTLTVDAKGRVLSASELSATFDLPCADTDQCGVVKVGQNIKRTSVDDRSVISIPMASPTEWGVVRLGSGFGKDCCEIYQTLSAATSTQKGGVMVPTNSNLSLSSEAALSVPVASTSAPGVATFPTTGGWSISSGIVSFSFGGTVLPIASTSATGTVSIPTANGLSVTGGVATFSSVGYVWPDASYATKGVVRIGSSLSVTGGLVSLPAASTSVRGAWRGDSNFNNSDGLISYSKPATTSSIGYVRPGTGVSVDGTGIISVASANDATASTKGIIRVAASNPLSVSGGVLTLTQHATTSVPGIVRGDASFFQTASTLSQTTVASAGDLGLVRIGSGLSVTAGLVTRSGLNDAAGSTKGVIQVGSNLAVAGGTLSLAAPLATTSTMGLIRPGTGLSVVGNKLRLTPASPGVPGSVRTFDTTLTINNGSVSVNSSALATIDSNTFTGLQLVTPVTLSTPSSGATVTLDLASSNYHTFALSSSNPVTLGTPLNSVNGASYEIVITHISTARTITLGSDWLTPSGVSSSIITNGTSTRIAAVCSNSRLYVHTIS